MPHLPRRFPLADAARWAVVVPVSVAVGYVLRKAGIHAAWIVAGILVAGCMALVTHREMPLNKEVERAARGVIGVLAGLSLVGIDWGSLFHYVVPGIALSLLTVAIGMGAGVLLSRREPEISTQTGILGMMPGGSSTMPVMARETGADYRLVALSQYLRLLIVSLTLPVIGGLTFGRPIETSAQSAHASVVPAVMLVVIALAGPYIGKFFRLPAPHIFGPLIITPLTALAFDDPAQLVLPEPLRFTALLLIGWMCGGGLSMPSLKLFAKQLPLILSSIVFTIAACAGSAWLLMHWVDVSYFEAYLATSPGGLETVLALASEGAVGPVVVSVQILRLITLLVIAGYLPQLINALARRLHRGEDDGSAEPST